MKKENEAHSLKIKSQLLTRFKTFFKRFQRIKSLRHSMVAFGTLVHGQLLNHDELSRAPMPRANPTVLPQPGMRNQLIFAIPAILPECG